MEAVAQDSEIRNYEKNTRLAKEIVTYLQPRVQGRRVRSPSEASSSDGARLGRTRLVFGRLIMQLDAQPILSFADML